MYFCLSQRSSGVWRFGKMILSKLWPFATVGTKTAPFKYRKAARNMFFQKKSPDIFERLEHEAADELRLLDDLGPGFFETEHLMELHAKVCEKIALQQRHLKIALSIGAAGIGWVLLWILAFVLNFPILALVALGLASASFATFFGLLVFTLQRFQTKGHLDHTRHSIEDELRSRRDKQRERMEDW